MPADPLLQRLRSGFVVETGELRKKVDAAVLELEREGVTPAEWASAWTRIGRALHTLKGSAATLGLHELAEHVHVIEDLAQGARVTGPPLPPPIVDAILQGLDAFQGAVQAEAAAPAPQAESEAPEAPAEAAPPSGREEDDGWRVTAAQLVPLLRDVERLQEIGLRTQARRRELADLEAQLDELAPSLKDGRLGALRSALERTVRNVGEDGDLAATIVDGLETRVRAIVTVPASTLSDALTRAVRDACRRLGKRARLSVVGADLSIDRRFVETLRAPLLHLVRNAVAHGVEKPDERFARGKHDEGSIVVRFERLASRLFVEVSDDGGGLDSARIREVALARGLVAADRLGAMTPNQVHELVFLSGFSTSTDVDEVSGRGVGLDVVRSAVESVNGKIEVQTRAGQGTSFVLHLPVELGSSRTLVARVGEHVVGLPLLAVEEVRRLGADELRTSQGRWHVARGADLIPLRDLGALLGLRPGLTPREGRLLVLVAARGRRTALEVDGIEGDVDLTVRPLPRGVTASDAYEGAATYLHGRLLLVVRPDWLAASEGAAARPAPRALVVDDSLTARSIHRAMLEAGGYVVHAAAGGEQALSLLASAPFDAIVADIEMDGMNGRDLVRAIRARPDGRGIRIVLVSAREGPAERDASLAAGADAFLSKRDCAAGRLLEALGSGRGESGA